jgi:hypothetical protein
MKTYFNLRSTIGTNSWPRRGLAALAMLAVAAMVGIALWQAQRVGSPVIPAAPAAQVVNPATPNPNVPNSGAGSASDGSAYVEYLLSGPSAGSAAPAVPNPNAPAQAGTSSDSGGAYAEYIEYLTGRPFPVSPRPAAPNPNLPISGTGSAYDGGSYASPRPTAQPQPIGLGIDLPPGTDLRGMPAGLTNYLRHKP